jgi:hypothetical protein
LKSTSSRALIPGKCLVILRHSSTLFNVDEYPLKERSRKDPASLCVFVVDLSFQY